MESLYFIMQQLENNASFTDGDFMYSDYGFSLQYYMEVGGWIFSAGMTLFRYEGTMFKIYTGNSMTACAAGVPIGHNLQITIYGSTSADEYNNYVGMPLSAPLTIEHLFAIYPVIDGDLFYNRDIRWNYYSMFGGWINSINTQNPSAAEPVIEPGQGYYLVRASSNSVNLTFS